jgi:hypothetical protein
LICDLVFQRQACLPSPIPHWVASASITKPCDKKCGPLIKIM